MNKKEEIFNEFKGFEKAKSSIFKKGGHSDVKPIFDMTQGYEQSLDGVFNDRNFASSLSVALHNLIDETKDIKVGRVSTKYKWDNQDYIINIFFDNKEYLVIRYKQRSNIEKFVRLVNNKEEKVTLSEYLDILVELNKENYEISEFDLF